MKNLENQKGFSLVELAIVIAVISALLVGLLFSKDMIQVARMTSVNSKMVKTYEAIGLFRQQHEDYLPGDMTHATCSRLDHPTLGKLNCGTEPGTTDKNNIFHHETTNTKVETAVRDDSTTNIDDAKTHDVASGAFLETGIIATCRQAIAAVRILGRMGMIPDVPNADSNTITATNCRNTQDIYPKGPLNTAFIVASTSRYSASPYNAFDRAFGALHTFSSSSASRQQPAVFVTSLRTGMGAQTSGTTHDGAFDVEFSNRMAAKFDNGSLSSGNITSALYNCRFSQPTTDKTQWCDLIYMQ